MSIGFHLQGNATDWNRGAAFLPSWAPMKFVDGGERAREVADNRIHCHLRHHVGEQNPPQAGVFIRVAEMMEAQQADKFIPPEGASWQEIVEAERKWYTKRTDNFFARVPATITKRAGSPMFEAAISSSALDDHARSYFNSFVDETFYTFADRLDSVSEYNEYFSNSQTQGERNRWIEWARACVRVWGNEFRTQPRLAHLGLVLAETAVGNDIPAELAALSHQYPWVHLGYHPYVPVWRGTIRPDAWKWYSGRWEDMDTRYRAAGYTNVTWFFGEFGAVGHTSPPVGGNWPNALDPMGGWKHENVYNGNLAAYHAMMLDWMNRTAQTLAWKQGRVLGATIFTSGGGNLWKHFELSGNDIIETGKFIGANAPAPGTQPPPPPPPPPTDSGVRNGYFGDRNWSDIAGTNKQQPPGWKLEYTPVGMRMPSGRDKVTTTLSEAVHRFVIPTPPDTKPTLPVAEGLGGATEGHTWDNGRSGLVLKNPNTFKVFATGTWADRLSQTVHMGAKNANKEYQLTVYADVHWHGYPSGNNPPEKEDIIVSIRAGEASAKYVSGEFPDRTWHKLWARGHADDNGDIVISIDIEAYWAHPRTVFIGGVELSEVAAPPPAEKCAAREPYAREFWVIPQSASQEEAEAAFLAARADGYRTVGYSYDDAGIGCGLKSRVAVLLGIPYSERKIYLDWYDENYTGTVVKFMPLPVVQQVPLLSFALPLAGKPLVTQRFGNNYEVYMQRYGIPGHNGTDFAANMRESILCMYPGHVLETEYDPDGYGLYTTVDHHNGTVATYAHMVAYGEFVDGDEVAVGDVLGYVGNSGWSSGPHLHVGVKHEGVNVDPEAFLPPL